MKNYNEHHTKIVASTQKSEQGCLLITLLFNLVLEAIHRTKQGKWKGPKLKRKKKNYLCTDDVICKTNPKDSTSLLLQIKQSTRTQSTHKNQQHSHTLSLNNTKENYENNSIYKSTKKNKILNVTLIKGERLLK